jgi:hypothetical protein
MDPQESTVKGDEAPLGPSIWTEAKPKLPDEGDRERICGNKKGDHVMLSSIVPDFSREKNGHRVSWQYHGRPEPFSKGNLMHTALSRPRWFQVGGKPITDVTTQKAIVEELLGEATGLSEDDKVRRSKYYVQFLKDAEQDGGYWRIDILSIAYQF